MDLKALHQILSAVSSGNKSVDEAVSNLVNLSYEDIEYAHIDHHRSLRKGFPEVIFGQGKTTEQITGIMEKMLLQENIVLVTRVDPLKADKVTSRFPDAKYHQDARMIICKKKDFPKKGKGTILPNR
jgi:NCAIR mutase (PurE)-related protein